MCLSNSMHIPIPWRFPDFANKSSFVVYICINWQPHLTETVATCCQLMVNFTFITSKNDAIFYHNQTPWIFIICGYYQQFIRNSLPIVTILCLVCDDSWHNYLCIDEFTRFALAPFIRIFRDRCRDECKSGTRDQIKSFVNSSVWVLLLLLCLNSQKIPDEGHSERSDHKRFVLEIYPFEEIGFPTINNQPYFDAISKVFIRL